MDKSEVDLRRNVTHKKGKVWNIRDNVDLYTHQSKDAVEETDPEVDHIWEIQVLKQIFGAAPVAVRTRLGHTQFRTVDCTYWCWLIYWSANCLSSQVVNDEKALNVTTKKVNSVKKGAVTTCLNRIGDGRLRTKPLEECFSRNYRDNGIAERIGNAIVQTYDDYLASTIPEKVTNQALANALTDGLTDMVEKMGLNWSWSRPDLETLWFSVPIVHTKRIQCILNTSFTLCCSQKR